MPVKILEKHGAVHYCALDIAQIWEYCVFYKLTVNLSYYIREEYKNPVLLCPPKPTTHRR